jgi:hypothetical protein
MILLFVIGGILSAWALLCVLGGERESRLRDLQAAIEANKRQQDNLACPQDQRESQT